MADLSVIIRRTLRKGVRSDQGIEGVISRYLGDQWQQVLSSSRRQREQVVRRLTSEIDLMLRQSSFENNDQLAMDTSIQVNSQTIVAGH